VRHINCVAMIAHVQMQPGGDAIADAVKGKKA
jgi:hypothetical protein